MVVVNDRHGFLNLNYTVVYFLFNEDEMDLYAQKVRKLNRIRSITRGIFRFEPVQRGANPYDMTQEIRRALDLHNVIIRLADNIHRAKCYGLDYIDLSVDDCDFKNEVNSFILSVCETNWIHLDSVGSYTSPSARELTSDYKRCGFIGEVFRQILYKGSHNPELTIDFNQQMESMRIADREESLRIIQTAVGNSKYDYIAASDRWRSCFEQRILKIKVYRKLNAKNPSFDFIFGNDVIEVKFATYAQSLTYAATLYAIMKGEHFSPQPFNKIYDEKIRANFKQWLEPIYYSLGYNPIERPFEQCFDAMCGGVTKKSQLSQIKSKITEILEDKFISQNHSKDLKLCRLELVVENPESKYYFVDVRPDKIIWELSDPYPQINE